jgi:hypothetical protein
MTFQEFLSEGRLWGQSVWYRVGGGGVRRTKKGVTGKRLMFVKGCGEGDRTTGKPDNGSIHCALLCQKRYKGQVR